MMLYHAYELAHAAVAPMRAAVKIGQRLVEDPHNPWCQLPPMRGTAAAMEMFETATRRYAKPEFGISRVTVRGTDAAIIEQIIEDKPFARLIHFERYGATVKPQQDPKVLIIAPMSGHFSTLLRGTVKKMLEDHDVYIVDWKDARNVPVTDGRFGLDEYIDYLIDFLRKIGPKTTLFGVCQPGVACLAATALMAETKNPNRPTSLIVMGSPIDTRISPTEPNRLAEARPLSWFRNNVTTYVPWPSPGMMRKVYPGFLQLSSFMAMNIDRHWDAHVKQFENLVKGDDDSSAAHQTFYDEYLAVMDLPAEFYLETIDQVFQRHLLPLGKFKYRQKLVRPELIQDTALMTVEGGRDDITGAGQTHAAQDLCVNLPAELRLAYTHPDVGHYGQFNGGRWRREIYPKLKEFIQQHL